MSDDKNPVGEYLADASPEEQRRFARVLLDAQARRTADFEVSEAAVRRSRVCSSIAITAVVVSVAFGADPRALAAVVIPFAVTWSPNDVAAATGRLGLRVAISRPSHPGVLLVLGWLLLILFTLVAVLEAVAKVMW